MPARSITPLLVPGWWNHFWNSTPSDGHIVVQRDSLRIVISVMPALAAVPDS